jgi:hypothetical protein
MRYYCYPIPEGTEAITVDANAGDPARAATLAATKAQMAGRWIVAAESGDGPPDYLLTERHIYTAERVQDNDLPF